MVKNLPANAGKARDAGLIPGLGRFSEGGHGNPLQYSCLKNPHGQRSLVDYSPWGHRELEMTEAILVLSCISLFICDIMQVFFIISHWVSPHENYLFILFAHFIGILVLFLLIHSLYTLEIMVLFTKYLNNIFSQFVQLLNDFVLWYLHKYLCIEQRYLILIWLNKPSIPIKFSILYISFKKLLSKPIINNIYLFPTNNFIVLSFTV